MAIRRTVGCLAVVLAVGCGLISPGAGRGGDGQGATTGKAGSSGSSADGGAVASGNSLGLNAAQQQTLDQLTRELNAGQALDAPGLLAKHAVSEVRALSYDPRSSEFMDPIQASALALDDQELAHLGSNGFVISKRSAFPTFVRGFTAIYSEDLPVYIDALR